MNRRNAFTLIELLVVIAIIAILAAILFPVFAAAREKARQTTCASNEKQIGLALLQYVQDYDELECMSQWSTAGTPANPNIVSFSQAPKWMDLIYPYVQSTGAFTCPDDTSLYAQYSPAANFTGANYTYNWGSYAANDMYIYGAALSGLIHSPFYFGANAHSGAATQPPVQSSQVVQPATTVLVVETSQWHGATTPLYNPQSYIIDSYAATGGYQDPYIVTSPATVSYRVMEDANSGANVYQASGIDERHSGMTNVLWCDGHVKAVNLDLLLTTGTNGKYTYFSCEADPD